MQPLIQKRSYGSVKVFWLDQELALSLLKKKAEQLIRERVDILKVILFGSLPEKRATPGSDADILILLKSSDQRFLDRPLTFSRYFEGLGLPVDLFCCTEKEAQQISVARRAMKTGIVLASARNSSHEMPGP